MFVVIKSFLKRLCKALDMFRESIILVVLFVSLRYYVIPTLCTILALIILYKLSPDFIKQLVKRVIKSGYVYNFILVLNRSMIKRNYLLLITLWCSASLTVLYTYFINPTTVEVWDAFKYFLEQEQFKLGYLIYALPVCFKYVLVNIAYSLTFIDYSISLSKAFPVVSSYDIYNYAGRGNYCNAIFGEMQYELDRYQNTVELLPRNFAILLIISLVLFGVTTWLIDYGYSKYLKEN